MSAAEELGKAYRHLSAMLGAKAVRQVDAGREAPVSLAKRAAQIRSQAVKAEKDLFG